jgi:hypothetical protein
MPPPPPPLLLLLLLCCSAYCIWVVTWPAWTCQAPAAARPVVPPASQAVLPAAPPCLPPHSCSAADWNLLSSSSLKRESSYRNRMSCGRCVCGKCQKWNVRVSGGESGGAAGGVAGGEAGRMSVRACVRQSGRKSGLSGRQGCRSFGQSARTAPRPLTLTCITLASLSFQGWYILLRASSAMGMMMRPWMLLFGLCCTLMLDHSC